MMQRIEKDPFFRFYPKRHEDLYKTVHSQLTGGLSVIFTRLANACETKIRHDEIANSETC